MREILFKGFTQNKNGTETIFINGKKIKGNWVFGNYVEHLPYTPSAFEKNIEKAKKQYEKDTRHYIARAGFSDWNMPRDIEFIEVIKETVSQYIGLLDKNKNKIFENDTVKILYTDWLNKLENDTRPLNSLTKEACVIFEKNKFELLCRNGYKHSIFPGEYGYVEVVGNKWNTNESDESI